MSPLSIEVRAQVQGSMSGGSRAYKAYDQEAYSTVAQTLSRTMILLTLCIKNLLKGRADQKW